MRRAPIAWRDVGAGVLFVVLGVAVALYARAHYELGEVARMGPGFFPFWLGWLLAGLGVIIALQAVRRPVAAAAAPRAAWRPVVAVSAAVWAFAMLIERAGLVPATLVLVFVACAGQRPYPMRRALVLAPILALLAWAIFRLGLQMNLPAFVIGD
jgi:hypothetical protein